MRMPQRCSTCKPFLVFSFTTHTSSFNTNINAWEKSNVVCKNDKHKRLVAYEISGLSRQNERSFNKHLNNSSSSRDRKTGRPLFYLLPSCTEVMERAQARRSTAVGWTKQATVWISWLLTSLRTILQLTMTSLCSHLTSSTSSTHLRVKISLLRSLSKINSLGLILAELINSHTVFGWLIRLQTRKFEISITWTGKGREWVLLFANWLSTISKDVWGWGIFCNFRGET